MSLATQTPTAPTARRSTEGNRSSTVDPKTPLTWNAYLAEGFVAGSYEILEGERVAMAGASWKHQRIVSNILRYLYALEGTLNGYCLCAPYDVVIRRAPLRTRQPDVFFITKDRIEAVGGIPDEEPLEAAPELIIEVLSPSETPRVLGDKLADFRAIGVQEAWIISPEAETVQVLRLTEQEAETVAVYAYGQTLRSIVFPAIELSTNAIFTE